MSFDMTIRYNRSCSRSVPLAPLSKFIGSLPDVKTVRTSLLVYEVPPDRRMEMTLEGACPDRVDHIELTIPYAYLEERSAENAYYQLAFMLATLLDWKLYDCQTGRYVRIPSWTHYSEQKAFDRLVLDKKTSPRDRTTMWFNFLTPKDIRSPKCGRAFFELMARRVPGALPEFCGTPGRRRPFRAAKDITYQQWPENFVWEGRDNSVWGMVGHLKDSLSSVRFHFQVDDPAPEQCAQFLKNASKLFQVDFACGHVFGKGKLDREDRKLAAIAASDVQTWLPSVPWIACFGPPYLEMFGKRKLMTAPFAAVERLGKDLVFARLVDDVSQCIKRTREYRGRQVKIKAALGLQYFFDPAQPKKKAVVPQFRFPEKPSIQGNIRPS
jgi:hypothetical protein